MADYLYGTKPMKLLPMTIMLLQQKKILYTDIYLHAAIAITAIAQFYGSKIYILQMQFFKRTAQAK
jgi:hypothetical protein